MKSNRIVIGLAAAAAAVTLTSCSRTGGDVGSVGTDWTGNQVSVDRIYDPQVQGMTCFLGTFERGAFGRITSGDWFGDPSNNAITCRQTGPLVIDTAVQAQDNADVFEEGNGAFFRTIRVARMWDEESQTIVYASYSRKLVEGSAKLGISAISTYEGVAGDVTWVDGLPSSNLPPVVPAASPSP